MSIILFFLGCFMGLLICLLIDLHAKVKSMQIQYDETFEKGLRDIDE